MPEAFQLEYVCSDYDSLKKKVEELEKMLKVSNEADARMSSVNIGHKDKGGEIKFYFDPFGDPAKNDAALEECKRMLKDAGGA